MNGKSLVTRKSATLQRFYMARGFSILSFYFQIRSPK